MIRWCSYCQKFLGEVAPYENLAMTHGICAACKPSAFDHTRSEFSYAEALRGVLHRVMQAGRNNDYDAIDRIFDEADRAKIRPVDILLGIISPALYQIGEDWQRGTITAADQRRFSEFCESIFDLIAGKLEVTRPAISTPPDNLDALLMNAPGNSHTLAIRILALWLFDKGSNARIVNPPLDIAELTEIIWRTTPRYLLISVALAEQVAGITSIVERMGELPSRVRPRIYVGGNAVKLGLIADIPGAELMADINAL